MDYLSNITQIAQWFLITSLKATIVIMRIMMTRLIFGERLPAKWQHALWFLLVGWLGLTLHVRRTCTYLEYTASVRDAIN